MNILFVHEVDWLRKVVFEPHALSELLALKGHNVYAVDYESMWESDRLVSPRGKTTMSRLYPEAQVVLERPPFIKLPVLSRMTAFSSYYKLLGEVMDEQDIDVVILYSVPTNGLQTLREAHRRGIPVIFRSIDVLHKLVPRVLSPLTKALEGVVYRGADRILTITPALSRYVIGFGVNPDKVGLLPLGVDVEPLPEAAGWTRKGIELPASIAGHIVVFAGTLPYFSGLDAFIREVPKLAEMIPSFRLLVIGDGVQRPRLEKLVKELGAGDRVYFTGMVPHSTIPEWVDVAEIGILTFPPQGATRDILPTKVLQYMARGKAVVSTPLPGMMELGLGEEQGVVYVKNGDWKSAILNALINRNALGKAARKYVEENHGYGRAVEQLEREMEELCR